MLYFVQIVLTCLPFLAVALLVAHYANKYVNPDWFNKQVTLPNLGASFDAKGHPKWIMKPAYEAKK